MLSEHIGQPFATITEVSPSDNSAPRYYYQAMANEKVRGKQLPPFSDMGINTGSLKNKSAMLSDPHQRHLAAQYFIIKFRVCLQLGGLCTRTDQNQTRNAVLFCSAAGTLGIPKSVVE